MDFQVERKREIVSCIKEKNEKNELSQKYLLDMQQEINRCNHIMRHTLRSQLNNSGRLACAGVFGTLGIFLSLEKIKTRAKWTLRNTAFVSGSCLVGAFLGYFIIGAKMFSNTPDYKKNLKVYMESLALDREVEPIIRGFRV